jgi:hypothetical protein
MMRKAGVAAATLVVGFLLAGVPTASGRVPTRSSAVVRTARVTSSPAHESGVAVPTTAPGTVAIGTHPALLSDAAPTPPNPVRMVIPSLDISVPVIGVSVGALGQLAVPPTTTVAAWYAGGPVPGQPGSAVIAAHVDYNGRPGVFFQLDQLAIGAEIVVVDAGGGSHSFVVRSRDEYAKTALPTDQIFDRGGPPTLTLVTCGGRFRPASHSYADNIVVQAVPVPT